MTHLNYFILQKMNLSLRLYIQNDEQNTNAPSDSRNSTTVFGACTSIDSVGGISLLLSSISSTISVQQIGIDIHVPKHIL